MNMEKFFINILYVAVVLTVIGQCLVGSSFYLGQGAFLIANIVYCVRDCVLRRPKADKIKNFTFLGITLGLILLRLVQEMG